MERRRPNFTRLALASLLGGATEGTLLAPSTVAPSTAPRRLRKKATARGASHLRDGLNRAEQAKQVRGEVTELRAKRPGRALLIATVHPPKKTHAHNWGTARDF